MKNGTENYGWTWCDGAEECEPPEPNKWWIQIGPLEEDGSLIEEICIIMVRNYKKLLKADPAYIKSVEARADIICAGLQAVLPLNATQDYL